MTDRQYRIFLAHPREVAHHVANGNDAYGFAIFHDGKVPVTAAVHFLKCQSQRIGEAYRFGIYCHDFRNKELFPKDVNAGHARKQVALAENASKLPVAVDHQKCAQIGFEHFVECLPHRRAQAGDHRFSRFERADDIFHQGSFESVLSNRTIELGQVHFAMLAGLVTRRIVVAAVRTNHICCENSLLGFDCPGVVTGEEIF